MAENIRSRTYATTWNNYPGDFHTKLQEAILATGVQDYVYQQEVGEEENTPHIQICVHFSAQRTPEAWQPDFHIELGVHLHWLARSNWKACAKYCCKQETSSAGSFSNLPLYIRRTPTDLFRLDQLRPWQETIITLCDADPEPRKIYWLWSNEGGVGKSFLTRHLVIKFRNNVRPVYPGGGSAKDIMYALAEMKLKHGMEPRMVIYDLPRSQTVPDFGGVEKIKDGLFFSPKYESGTCLLDDFPHVVVFANYAPEEAKLSKDRWVIICVDE